MTKPVQTLDFYFSFISLWSYVGSLPFQELVAKHDLEVRYKPVDLMAVFAAGGGKPVRERPAQRQAYRLVEMQRWRKIRGIELELQPKFYPADPTVGHRMLIAATDRQLDVSGFVHAALKTVWADEGDIADPETLVRLADQNGLPGRVLLDVVGDEALLRKEKALTQEAIDRDVFGAPFYFYGDEPFWGQDRLDQLDAALMDERAPITPPRIK